MRDSNGRRVVVGASELTQTATDIFGDEAKAETHVMTERLILPIGQSIGVSVVRPPDGDPVVLCDDVTLNARTLDQLENRTRQLERTVYDLLTAMSRIVQSRDPNAGEHDVSLAHLARAIAVELGLDSEKVEEVSMAGLLHDIGKYAVPDDVLSNPGRLSEDEFARMKEHPSLGFEALAGIGFKAPVAEAVQQHHERLDGSGYPKGLRGDEIGVAARILAVADVVESMTEARPYRETPGLESALEEILGRPDLYDPAVAEACARVCRAGGQAQ